MREGGINRLVPVGAISAYAGSTAPTGWLMCNGTSTAGYPVLAALVGATTPDLTGRFPMGKTASSTGSTLLGSGGSNTIAESNLPAHGHAVGTLATTPTGDHQHTGTVDGGGGHTHGVSILGVGGHTHADGSYSASSHSHTVGTNTTSSTSHTHTATSVAAAGITSSSSGTATTSSVAAAVTGASVSDGTYTHGASIVSADNHQHTFTTDSIGSHGHAITGSTGSVGSGTAYFQPFVSVNYIIKHD